MHPQLRKHLGAGLSFAAKGQYELALAEFKKALMLEPKSAEAASNAGAMLYALGRPAEAIPYLERAIGKKPNFADAEYNLGNALFAMGRLDDARVHFERALRIRPAHANAHLNLGNLLLVQGASEDAIVSFQRAIEIDATNALVHSALGVALQQLGRNAEASDAYAQAIALAPQYAQAHHNLATLHQARGAWEAAEASYRAAIAREPRLAAAHNNLGTVLEKLGKPEEALHSYASAFSIDPSYAQAASNAGGVCCSLAKYEEARRFFEAVVALHPDDAGAYNNLGVAQRGFGDFNAAAAAYRRALALNPELEGTHANLGTALMELGRFDESVRSFERALELSPTTARFYRGWAAVRSVAADDPVITAMELLAERIGSLDTQEQIELHFALAKVYADLRQYDRSFDQLVSGNEAKRRTIDYDETSTLKLFERIRAVFTAEMVAGKSGGGHPSSAPVFIVGMMRSGTTLIEQILASHPQVHAAGERDDLDGAISAKAGECKVPYPELIDALTAEDFLHIGASYVKRISAKAGGTAPGAGTTPTTVIQLGVDANPVKVERITDKMPSNFLYLGVIALALPNARIIHVRRDPLDTCISCYSLLFDQPLPYMYDLAELGRYYRAYERLMEHWRRVLPAGAMIEVQYEELVRDLEPQVRRILDYCGLAWDPRCLEFHKTQRVVRTASVTQVRKPLYATSVGRHQHYRTRLGPLLSELDEARRSG